MRPPKRLSNAEDLAPQLNPKRPRPSPEAGWRSPQSTVGSIEDTNSESLLSSSLLSPYRATPSHGDDSGGSEHQSQDGLVPMDWTPGVIDLTTGHTEHEAEGGDTLICYGALCEARAQFKTSADAKRLLANDGKFCLLNIARSGSHYALSARAGNTIANLDLRTCRALRALEELAGVRAEGVVESAYAFAGSKALPTKGSAVLPLSVNVYGPLSVADQCGDALAAASASLQLPFFLPPGYGGYFNPQMFRVGNEMQDQTHLVGLTEKDLRAKAISNKVEQILGSLYDTDAASSDAISEANLEQEALVTALTEHQRAALQFICQREDGQSSQNMQKRLRDLVNIPSSSNIPSYATGGILADVMGLGKTLSMLSAIISTIDSSRSYAVMHDTSEPSLPSGGTLVVVTSAQVLKVWETEIEKHVKPNILNTCRFHGMPRPASPGALTDCDVVLTTYATLSAEYKTGGVLHEVEWYRIVLDEAHWIRNQSSAQFKAAAALNSNRRWCLTGTPIQNNLNDLVSLLSFLHFEPFCSPAIFRRYILEPLSKDPQQGAAMLKAPLRAICLRRDETLLKLPEPLFEQVKVALQDTERSCYNDIMAQCALEIDRAVSSKVKIKKYGTMFAATMKLRRLCNHGTVVSVLTGNGSSAEAVGSPEDEQNCDFCNGADEDAFELIAQGGFCPECGRQLGSTASSGRSTPKQSGRPRRAAAERNNLTRNGVHTTASPGSVISSKIKAVMDRLGRAEPGSKSLIFSSWVATLNQLQHHLTLHGIPSLRIDGTVSHPARLQILSSFQHAGAIPVLLMTVQTGAVGLNLTAANYVHIVEPQWNPSVEEQAIARAVRMGQTRSVRVIRYVVKNSVEENIVQLQRRKRSLAKFTLEGASEVGDSRLLDDLRFVLSLDLVR